MCNSDIHFASFSIFRLNVGTVLTVWYFLFFILLDKKKTKKLFSASVTKFNSAKNNLNKRVANEINSCRMWLISVYFVFIIN